jgi:AmmeMemoRadiSam system protein A
MNDFELSQKEKQILLSIARNELCLVLGGADDSFQSPNIIPEMIELKCGLFVSIYNKSTLRACLGRFQCDLPLWKAVREMTRSSAQYDTRFPEIRKHELNDLIIEISVLTPLQRILHIDEIKLGTHGIYLKNGTFSGTYLPQVAEKTGWSVEEFLSHCSKEKAGIGWDGWKNKETEVFIYRAIVFSEHAESKSDN